MSNGVIVVGSLHYDIFIDSPNLPRVGETVTGYKWYPKLGGKGGNQAIAASLYPVPTTLISAIGSDDFAKFILDKLQKAKININFIYQLANHDSGMSVAISNAKEDYGAVIVSGANLHIKTEILDNPDLWKNAGILMIQNEINEKTNILAAKKAKEKGLKVFYNAAPAKKINPDFFNLVDILLVNTIEAQDISGIKIDNLEDIKNVSKELSKRFPICIITTGAEGIVLCEKGKDPHHFKGIQVKVKSTHGAGDTFAGTFCAALVSGKDIAHAADIANKKAAEFISY